MPRKRTRLQPGDRRGVEVMIGAYSLRDLAPRGRDERDGPNKMEWVRHHDRYPDVMASAGKHQGAKRAAEDC